MFVCVCVLLWISEIIMNVWLLYIILPPAYLLYLFCPYLPLPRPSE